MEIGKCYKLAIVFPKRWLAVPYLPPHHYVQLTHGVHFTTFLWCVVYRTRSSHIHNPTHSSKSMRQLLGPVEDTDLCKTY